MPEIFVLFIADRINSVDKLHILWKNGSEREGMDPRSAGFLLFQRRPARDRSRKRYILRSVHLLIISPETHQQEARKRYMIFLAEIHQTLCRLFFQMENIER